MKVVRGNYKDYVKFNGEKYADSPLALIIKENECDYYLVYKGKKMFSDVVVFPKEDNLINLNITLCMQDILKTILKEFKQYYPYITFALDANRYKNVIFIRDNCDCLEEHTEKVDGKYDMTYIKVKL